VESQTNRIITPDRALVSPAGKPIRRSAVKWERDPELNDLIAYFNEDRFFTKKMKTDQDRFRLLNAKEIEAIVTIATRCKEDFTYAARNFFYITTEKREEQLLVLKESQMLIYEHMMRLKARGLPMKIMLIKARRLGASTLCEAMIAWKTMFFKNVNAIVVSYDPAHAAYLFAMMQFIYDRMPWWLKPMISSRKVENGLVFSNPDYEQRRVDPGLGSQVMVQAANKRTGVGQGVRITAAHISEYSDFDQNYARELIEADLGPALAEEDPSMFAILESTAKGTGNYSYSLWNKNVELGDQAEWHPVFLPWFFESTRFLPPLGGWRPEPEEVAMRERIELDWTRCDNADCLQYHERYQKTRDITGDSCPTCKTGKLSPYALTDGQLLWMQKKRKNAAKDEESQKALKQEQATTSESAFQSSGTPIFSENAYAFAASTVRPPLKEGFFDKIGKLHGCNPYDQRRSPFTNQMYQACYLSGCNVDHENGNGRGENPVKIWKEPERGAKYCTGADVAEGYGGKSDYSSACVFKINQANGADEQVAIFRSNTTSTIEFAQVLNCLGRWYNDALMAPENNVFDTTVNELRYKLAYPNLYRMKDDRVVSNISGKFGWRTQGNSKPRLYQTWNQRLGERLVIVRSRTCLEEMKTFVKDYTPGASSMKTGAGKGDHDDTLMASMISFYVAHENDWDENLGQLGSKQELTMEAAPWHWQCQKCNLEWPAVGSDEQQCPRCSCRVIQGRLNRDVSADDNQSDPFAAGKIGRYQAQDYAEPMEVTSDSGQILDYDQI
tara:strand:+ start:4361 stop:6709 length:2349 start_codon:yes stop_codon:yes gene_type:complete